MNILQPLKAEREKVARQLNRLDMAIRVLTGLNANTRRVAARQSRRRISARGLANIRTAQKARWGKARREQKVVPIATARKRTLSAAARRKIAASQRARWTRVRQQKKSA
jgi:hypothetical protein